MGAAEWTALYGVTSQIGATSIFPTKPKNGLISFLSHLAFGAAKMAIAVNIGDNRLFKLKNLVIELEDQKDDRGTELSFDL